MEKETVAGKNGKDLESIGTRGPICFTTLLKLPEAELEPKERPGMKVRKTKTDSGQKKTRFDIILDEKPDPMVLSFHSPDIEKLFRSASLTVNEQEVTVIIDDKDHYVHEVVKLPEKIIPQFSAGYFEGEVLNLFLKKQMLAGDNKNGRSTPMVWCSENVFAELERMKARAEENLERYHAVQLDLQNHIVQSRRERKEFEDRFASRLLLNVLEVQDNFDRALEAEKTTRGKKSLMEGVSMIRKQLNSVLACSGVSEIDALGRQFDPMRHEALMTEENSEVEENTVLEVIQKGYMYNDKVLRLAKVKVSKPKTEK